MGMAMIKAVFVMVPVLMSVAYLTLIESKMLGYSQLSKGPNVVGMYGMLQPLADGVKLFTKEMLIPSNCNLFLYMFSPVLALTLSLFIWFFLPLFKENLSYTMLMILVVSSMSVYGMFLSGWSSNSKYAFLGAISATAQMISYEMTLSLMMMILMIVVSNLNVVNFINNQNIMYIMPFFPVFMMFVMSNMAECNSAPFDLTEGESELVSGFNIEYSAMSFALFFLAEYSHIIFSSLLIVMFFLKGYYLFLLFFIFFFVWISTSFPSMSYDQLMFLIWKDYLPMTFGFLLFNNLMMCMFM